MSSINPFLDSAGLYASASRLAQRTSALHGAKIAGRHVADVIVDLAAPLRTGAVIADVGCGRGTTTAALTTRHPTALVIGIDLSAALLRNARERSKLSDLLQADFHRLPMRSGTCDLVVAAFCLYHAAEPIQVIKEIRRCMSPDGNAILVTKSADSYTELDELVAAAGLDTKATERPSLYETAHGTILPDLARGALDVGEVISEQHLFRFADLRSLSEYLVTNPKYVLPPVIQDDPDAVADKLRHVLPDQPVITSSVVTYVVAARSATS